MSYVDRAEAGSQLARRLGHLRGLSPVVAGVTRGGVPVAVEVARQLEADLDWLGVRRLTAGPASELTVGAVAEDGTYVINSQLAHAAGLTRAEIEIAARLGHTDLARELRRLQAVARHEWHRPSLSGRNIIVVDDGMTTGATARAACTLARAWGAASVLLAVPVAPQDLLPSLRGVTDEAVALETPWWFTAIGESYADFGLLGDSEMAALLSGHEGNAPTGYPNEPPTASAGRDVAIDLGWVRLFGHHVPAIAGKPVGVLASAAATARHGSRMRLLAARLNRVGISTVSCDLLVPIEEFDRTNLTDVHQLARRLIAVSGWLREHLVPEGAQLAYVGSGASAAAALLAAEQTAGQVGSVVAVGVDPKFIHSRLGHMASPTLVVNDPQDGLSAKLVRQAITQAGCTTKLVELAGVRDSLHEFDTLDTVGNLAADWILNQHVATLPLAV